jgi:hypothetical protein
VAADSDESFSGAAWAAYAAVAHDVALSPEEVELTTLIGLQDAPCSGRLAFRLPP